MDPISFIFFRKDVPMTLRDRQKDECMALKQHSMFVASYEAKFHALCRYVTQFVTTEKERIHLFVKGLDFKVQVLSFHIIYAGKTFNQVSDYVKKVEGVKREGQAKVMSKRDNN